MLAGKAFMCCYETTPCIPVGLPNIFLKFLPLKTFWWEALGTITVKLLNNVKEIKKLYLRNCKKKFVSKTCE